LAAAAAPPADAEKELQAVRDRIEELQRSMRRDTDRRDALSGQLRDAEENVRGAREKLGDVRKRLAESDKNLEAIAADRRTSEAALREQRDVLAAELRTAYVGGRQEQFKLLLSQEDPAALGRMLVYYSYFGRARASKISEIQGIVAQLDEAEKAEAAERVRLAALEAEGRQQLSAVDAARDERSRALKAMNAQIRTRNDSIAKLKREAASLEKLIADLRKAMSDLPPTGGQAFEKVRGRLSWPVAGKITARFGQARGGGMVWNGVQIEAPRGTPVKALYDGRVAFADLSGRQATWTGDRTEFLGRNGTPDHPASLERGERLSDKVGAGLDPCAALQTMVELRAGGRAEIVFFLGQAASAEEARILIALYRGADLDATLRTISKRWDDVLGTVQVTTPDRAMNFMLNRWLLYQTLACRIWARSAFYQAGGAYGFRDQLQDVMALMVAQRGIARAQLLRAAARQFVEGDVQHWWHRPSGRGVRTGVSDDLLWLPYVTIQYLELTDDVALLDEIVPFLDGPTLAPGKEDAYFEPRVSAQTGTLFEHCARALDRSRRDRGAEAGGAQDPRFLRRAHDARSLRRRGPEHSARLRRAAHLRPLRHGHTERTRLAAEQTACDLRSAQAHANPGTFTSWELLTPARCGSRTLRLTI